mgnify:CR=1 FL=1
MLSEKLCPRLHRLRPRKSICFKCFFFMKPRISTVLYRKKSPYPKTYHPGYEAELARRLKEKICDQIFPSVIVRFFFLFLIRSVDFIVLLSPSPLRCFTKNVHTLGGTYGDCPQYYRRYFDDDFWWIIVRMVIRLSIFISFICKRYGSSL